MRLSKIEKINGPWFEITLSENDEVIRNLFMGCEQTAIETANEWEGYQPLTIDDRELYTSSDIEMEAA